MRILTLDLATKSGWASSVNGIIESGVQDFTLKRGESKGILFLRFRKWLENIIGLTNPTLVVFEQVHHRGGWSTQIAVGLMTRVMEVCDEKEIDYTSVHSMSLKKFACGTGKASKEDMIREAKRRHSDIEILDDNQADALLILAWAREEFK